MIWDVLILLAFLVVGLWVGKRLGNDPSDQRALALVTIIVWLGVIVVLGPR